jgi:hypothetical protein
MKQLREIFEEESQIAQAMERMVESQQQDQDTLEKYSHKDNLMIKVNFSPFIRMFDFEN